MAGPAYYTLINILQTEVLGNHDYEVVLQMQMNNPS